jgi:mannose/cellobiose epimerase-like protein (N-acyl-D-glucosamine 2-epimerase family)
LLGCRGSADLGHPEARRLAEATLGFLDEGLADPDGGYRESLPAALPRRANPHMHLLEAMLAWFEATGEARFLDRANALAGLFARHFFDPATGTLGEFFAQDWRPAGAPRGLSVEPGHHFEWVWLLVRLAELGGDDHRSAAGTLYRFGLAHGLDTRGFAVDEVDKTGAVRRATRRAWPQTELIKARLAMGDHDDAASDLHSFLDSYLDTKVPGLWTDQFDGTGQPLADVVPASTLYHIVVAFDEAVRVAAPTD